MKLAVIHTELNDIAGAAGLPDKALAICRQWGMVRTLNEANVAQYRPFWPE